ncbi:MAG: hypothetical protein GXO70_10525 [Acidobacteria bacterium]|nr:hypothetical protein [Acidobacteriota bacterium]
MVTFIVGQVNSGKTTKMAAIYKKRGGDGILCPKYMENGIHLGYNLVHLKTGESIPFARFTEALPEGWDETFRFGPHSFSEKAQKYAAEIIETASQTGISPIFLDEIGPVELEGQGFAPLFRTLLENPGEIIVSVRDFLLEQIIEFFEIKNNQIYKEQI